LKRKRSIMETLWAKKSANIYAVGGPERRKRETEEV
jgi:hypothetical protein